MSDQLLEKKIIEAMPGCTENLAIEVSESLEFGMKRKLTDDECQGVFKTVEEIMKLGLQLYTSGARVLNFSQGGIALTPVAAWSAAFQANTKCNLILEEPDESEQNSPDSSEVPKLMAAIAKLQKAFEFQEACRNAPGALDVGAKRDAREWIDSAAKEVVQVAQSLMNELGDQ